MPAVAAGDARQRIADHADVLADTAYSAADGVATGQCQRCAEQQGDDLQGPHRTSRHGSYPIFKHQSNIHNYLVNIDL